MPKLSVIVPVYKVEKYLSKCIQSIIKQTFTDWELILIDDGSPDKCPQICDQYAAKDNRIVVIHQDNQGVSVARNRGLDKATGEYIGFVDSDDYIEDNMYEIILSAMKRTDSNVGICGFKYIDGVDGNIIRLQDENIEEILTQKEVLRRQFDIPWSIRLDMCNKVFSKKLIGELRFDKDLHCCEDTLFLHQLLLKTEQAVYVIQPLYVNVRRIGSAMQGGLHVKDIEKSLSIHKYMADSVREVYPDLYPYAYAYYIDACIWKMNANKNLTHNKKEVEVSIGKMRKRIRNEILGITKCKHISYKQKIVYSLMGFNIFY